MYKERENAILEFVEKLDITPTMFKNASEKYHHLAEFLSSHGVDADFYPQGSFALGTVVRPSTKDPNAAYDLDAICQIKSKKDDISPSELWKTVQTELEHSEIYGSRLRVNDKCLTIEYADIGEYGFSIDIVPAADESDAKKAELQLKSPLPHLIPTAIAIPKKTASSYRWITNNPKGYKEWFNGINGPFAAYTRTSFRKKLYDQNTAVFASIEDIPSELERSSIQRVIQILKYHRDVHYSKRDEGDKIKPISAIINTLVTSIAQSARSSLSAYELLDYVTKELAIYSSRQTLDERAFSAKYANRSVIQRSNGQWKIPNPANPEDNLADAWNTDKTIPFYFFKWIGILREDLIESLRLDEQAFRTSIENAFGPTSVQSIWGNRYKKTIAPPTPIAPTSTTKPWGNA